jgi:hypothetical protein
MTGREGAERLQDLPRWVRLTDYLCFGLLVLTAYVTVFGTVSVGLFGVTVRASSPLRLLGQAALLTAIRHWRCRTPSLREHFQIVLVRARDRTPWLFPGRWPPALTAAIWIGLLSRIVVLLIGYMAVESFGYSFDSVSRWRVATDEWRNLPARWDSGWYIQIAMRGYEWNPASEGQQSLIFFPAYPIAMRAMTWMLGRDVLDAAEIVWAGVFVSCIAFPIAVAYLYRLARVQVGAGAARMTVAALAAYPFALFYSAAYTESLYLLATVATFYHFTRGQLWRAAAWGVLTGLTRPNGWMTGVSLVLMIMPAVLSALGLATLRARLTRVWPSFETIAPGAPPNGRVLPLVAAASAPALGLVAYSAYTFYLTGHPFTWAHLMTYWGRDFNGLSLIGGELSQLRALGPVRYIGTDPLDAMNFMALAFGLSSLWPVTRRLGLPYGVFVLANIALPALSGGLESVGRYSSVLFPSFIWLGAMTPVAVRPAVLVLLALGQGLAAALFFTWRSVF